MALRFSTCSNFDTFALRTSQLLPQQQFGPSRRLTNWCSTHHPATAATTTTTTTITTTTGHHHHHHHQEEQKQLTTCL
jgi:hypothetical protein